MKIAFKATEHHKTHTLLSGIIFKDGDVLDVPDEEAKRLLKEFPENFYDPKEEILEKVMEGGKDKMVRGGKKKGDK